MPQKIHYVELIPAEFRKRIASAPIAYLPLGTLEWHGEHLPLGSDGLQSNGFLEHLAREVGGVVLPMLFMGPDRAKIVNGKELYGMDFICGEHESGQHEAQQLTGSAYYVSNETFHAIIEGILKQLGRAGFRIVVGHGHGPSTAFFRDNADQWREKFNLETFNCWDSKVGKDPLGIQTDHAAANETSLMMAIRPDLVQMDRLPTDPNKWPLAIAGQDPRQHASPKLGKKILTVQVERMTTILREALSQL